MKKRAKPAKSPFSSLLARLTRLATFVLVVTLGLGLFAARRAKATATEGAMAIGEQLLTASADAPLDSSAHRLFLNGQSVQIATAQTSQPLAAVLDRFQAQCEDHADGMADDLAALGASIDAPPTRKGFSGLGILRDEKDGRGVVACFAAGRETSFDALAERLERFAQTHDLADLGHLRYVAARTLESGATLVVATWTDENLKLDAMFPATGDADGEDPTWSPRPNNARRVFSARDGRLPHGVTVYEMSDMPEIALGGYETQMKAQGWSAVEAVAARTPESRAFSRGGVDVLVTTQRTEDKTVLSIVELAAPTVKVAKAPKGTR